MRHWVAVGCAVILLLSIPALHAQPWRQGAAKELMAAAGDHRTVLLGEMHGTQEIPLVVGDVVEHWSRSQPVLLALEIHASEQRTLVDYLDGDGAPASREGLRQRPYWSVPQKRNDGRRSEDMLDLVERIRSLRAEGRDVAILAFDVANGVPRDSQWRDGAMAANLRSALAALPHGRLLVVTGNVHAMRLRPDYAPPQMQTPMGTYLQDLRPISIDIAAATGAFWACPSPACGPVPVVPGATAGGLDDDAPFHYRIVLPQFTPARRVGDVVPAEPGLRAAP
jgi:hypothetical protein